MRIENIIGTILVVGGLIFSAGCQTGNVVAVKKSTDMPPLKKAQAISSKSTSVKPLKYYTKVSKARIVINVIDLTKNSKFNSIGKSIVVAIANSGFEVAATNPYLVVSLKNSLGRLDKLGNFYVYKGKSEITVNRTRIELIKNIIGEKTLIAGKTISETGARKLGKEEAISSLADKLAESSAKWVKNVCDRESKALQAVKVDFDMNIFTTAFKDYNVAKGINLILLKAANKPGVLSCVQTSKNTDKLSVEFVYRKKNYPHGLVNQGENTIKKLKTNTLEGRASEIMSSLFK